jgi:hypothetical protein
MVPTPFAAALLAVGLLAAPGEDPRHLAVTCRVVEGSPATVEITSRNASESTLEARVYATLWLTAVPRGTESLRPSSLLTAFDPKTGSSQGPFETPETVMELPVGGSHSVVIDLTRLRWSLSPEDVDAPRELWELNAWGEYDLRVVVWSRLVEPLRFADAESLPVRVWLPEE